MDEQPLFSRQVDLEVDGSEGHLSSRGPKEIREGAQRATFRQFGKWGVQANVTHLLHGTVGGKPASIVGFDMRFLSEAAGSNHRFSKAKIVVTFEAVGTGPVPTVKTFAPKIMEGSTTRVRRFEQREVSANVSIPTGAPLDVGGGAAYSVGQEYDKDYRVRIDGKKWSSDEDAEDDNMVIWNLSENSKQGEGIPADFRVGLLVTHHGGPFQATVRVKATTKSNISLFGWPWPDQSPVVLSPNVVLGNLGVVNELDKVTDDQWQSLIDLQSSLDVSSLHVLHVGN